jgi:hypothetical protein
MIKKLIELPDFHATFALGSAKGIASIGGML